jgi:pyridoxal/pyridoxine/pyridoxamine kinase
MDEVVLQGRENTLRCVMSGYFGNFVKVEQLKKWMKFYCKGERTPFVVLCKVILVIL